MDGTQHLAHIIRALHRSPIVTILSVCLSTLSSNYSYDNSKGLQPRNFIESDGGKKRKTPIDFGVKSPG